MKAISFRSAAPKQIEQLPNGSGIGSEETPEILENSGIDTNTTTIISSDPNTTTS